MLSEDNKQTYVIISTLETAGGIFNGLGSIASAVISKCIKANDEGYIPVIDGVHNGNPYFKDGRKFKDNTWEYFFKQPNGISLDIVDKINDNSQILSWDELAFNIGESRFDPNLMLPEFQNDDIARIQLQKKHIKFLKLSDEVKKYINENYKKIVGDETEILGILCRGTDYIKKRPAGHAMPVPPSQLIKEARDLMAKYHYKKIYVATEDKQIYETFKQEFGDMLLPNTQYMYDTYENAEDIFLAQVKVNRPNHQYTLAIEYLFSMYILANCKYFIASNICSGIYFVCVLSNFYKDMKYIHIWDRGQYNYRTKIGYTSFWQRIFSVKNEVYENIVRKVITILGIKIKFIKEIK